MNKETLHSHLINYGVVIERCIKDNLLVPAQILLYSAIDTCGWLASDDEYATRNSFIEWVDVYLLKAKTLGCTAIDLYAARCGLLHTGSPNSTLSDRGKARRICVAWGSAQGQELQHIFKSCNTSDQYVVVNIYELFDAWTLGVGDFVESLDDSGRARATYEKAQKFFVNLPKDLVADVNRLTDEM